ncbi:hypothetical protein M3N64_01010 [Sporolactobacillus sp. CPB3-1]|uniref:Uncharacterized protein n=1 Tax=Sporolactobacillus mangiferae TaxID=2940498 RepID=A0ABT0M6R3_9BACL|nr:hypothetical protein [Sporolactobacillus mangiferae]MCL1630532.1 hypothetical protein [Sporolactobacillus mangiferae]
MSAIVKNMDLSARGLWFPITLTLSLLVLVLFMKKKQLTWREIYLTYGSIGFLTWVIDTLTGNILDLYDVGHAGITGIGDFLSFSFVPSSLAVIFLNFRTEKNKGFMILLFTAISMIIYWGVRASGYFKDKGWNIFLALAVFIIAYWLIIPLHLRLMRNNDRHMRK